MTEQYSCWSRQPRLQPSRVIAVGDRSAAFPARKAAHERFLPYGNGRSYSDVCLTDGGVLLLARGMDRFIDFDRRLGIIRCEAGVLLSELLAVAMSSGWFPAVTPGTRYVTVGGAIANDVHGKNHHRAGTFGCHVRELELLRSDGSRLICGPQRNPGWFEATVGGLGLTGLITWAELQLIPVASPFMVVHARRFANLTEFWSLNEQSELHHAYTVAWIDCLAPAGRTGQGLYFCGDHAPASVLRATAGKPAEALFPAEMGNPRATRAPRLHPAGFGGQEREGGWTFPFDPPFSLVNRMSLTAFNFLYLHRSLPPPGSTTHFDPFFYPLDRLGRWNRVYGPKGFYQYQCVVPWSDGRAAIDAILTRISASRQGSFLAVLKTFGSLRSPGLLSFAREGISLALDFPNRGPATHRLLAQLDCIVAEAGGALYPAKDSRMPADMFRSSFPAWERFLRFRDPAFSSSFASRVGLEETCAAS